MVYNYTSKTSGEIKTIIANLENQIVDANVSGKQVIDYNGIKYSIEGFVEAINKQIEFWLQKLNIALISEGELTNTKRFERYEGYV